MFNTLYKTICQSSVFYQKQLPATATKLNGADSFQEGKGKR
ncbi:hypothetical protein C942_03880 [Photobacterium marinum]|uniref:Uncharacterized protein n=1 Tax=Photobacterium marinum TaxID=1056511 RepID=L8J3M5_9GAMM|nr:hypothetical protein C942_03880 [Photobacterium marinum]